MFGLYGTFLQYQLGLTFLGACALTGLPLFPIGGDDENPTRTSDTVSGHSGRDGGVRAVPDTARRTCFHAAVDYFESIA